MTDPRTQVEATLAALRARIQALGPDAIAEISRSAKGRAPQAQVRLFRDGLTPLDIRLTLAIASVLDEVEAAHAADGNVARFPTAGGGKVKKARVKKPKAAMAPEAASEAPETAGAAPEADDSAPEAAKALEAVGGAPAAAMAPEAAGEAPEAAMAPEAAREASGVAAMSPEGDGGAPFVDRGVDELREKAAALTPGDVTGANAIIEAAVVLPRMDELEKDRLIGAMKRALGREFKKASLEAIWERAKAALRPSADELAAADAAVRAADKDAQRARLAPLVDTLANDPRLIDRVTGMAAALGVVREERANAAVYLTATSRLHRKRCIALLRRGAPATGKNFLAEKVFALLPPESIVTISSGSSQALIYSGGSVDNVDFLKHKLVYLPEAASTLAVKNGVESDFTAMVRVLISEGRIHRHIVTGQNGGPGVGLEIVRNGPIAVVVTSARSNIDEELRTRLLLADSDESLSQSSLILTALLDEAAGAPHVMPPSDAEIETFRDFQRWLELDAPYDVVLPYASAVRAAFVLTTVATPRALRVRRDIGGVIAAVSASAILHKAQRDVDANGRIVATMDDYRHASWAFTPGLEALYRPHVAPGVILLVKAIEGLVEAERRRIEQDRAALFSKNPNAIPSLELTFDGSARATHKQLQAALGLASGDVISRRIADALTAGVIEHTNPNAPRAAGARYRVKIGSAALTASGGVPVFPTPDMVETMLRNPARAAAALAAISAEENRAQAQAVSEIQGEAKPAVNADGREVDENGEERV